MKYILSIIVLSFIPLVVFADAPKVVPVKKPDSDKWQEIKADKGRMLTLSAEPASRWMLIDDESVDFRATDGGKYGDFVSAVEGRFKLTVTSPAGEVTKIIIVVGDSPPAPPNPPPVDVLKKKLADSFASDSGTDKVEQAKDLIELYKQLAVLAKDKSYIKASDLLKKAHDVADTLIGKDALVGVRTIVKDELSKIFPVDVDLTDDQRTKAADLFNKLVGYLGDIVGGK